MRVLLFAALAALSLVAGAAERSYAVLSLVGDRLLISYYNPGTGSRIDRNDRQYVALEGDTLDSVTLRAVKAAVTRAERDAKVELLAVAQPGFYAAANATLDHSGVSALLPVLQPELKPIAASHWIIVTKYRADTRAQLLHGSTGTGQLEGLGFYVDRVKRLRNVQTGEVSTGFVAPFAYLRFSLVDAATGAVLREEAATLTATVSRQSAMHPWDALTGEEKARYLESLIGRAAAESVPKLLAP